MGEHRRVGAWINTLHYYVNGKRDWRMGVEHGCCEDAKQLRFYESGWSLDNRCCEVTVAFCPWCGIKLPGEVFLKEEAAKDPEIKECFKL